jgi:hypothetical protein
MSRAARKWTDEKIEAELRRVTGAIGSFPTANELRGIGMNDLCCAATKTGGLVAWAARLGLSRKFSDSDFGWMGEETFCELARKEGIPASRTGRVKSAYDVLLDDTLRVDVKTANIATYGASNGWFYRIGKDPQADVVALLQIDTRTFYGLPWWACPITNVTISPNSAKYAPYRDNWPAIRRMIALRKLERAIGGPVAEVA